MEEKERIRIQDCELSVRTTNCLMNEGFVYLDELEQVTERELIRIKDFGRKSLKELLELLNDQKIGLRDKPFTKVEMKQIAPDVVWERLLNKLTNVIELAENREKKFKETAAEFKSGAHQYARHAEAVLEKTESFLSNQEQQMKEINMNLKTAFFTSSKKIDQMNERMDHLQCIVARLMNKADHGE